MLISKFLNCKVEGIIDIEGDAVKVVDKLDNVADAVKVLKKRKKGKKRKGRVHV